MSGWLTTRKQVMMVSAGALLCLFAAPAGVLAGTPGTKMAPPAPSRITAAPLTTKAAGGADSCGYPDNSNSTPFNENETAQQIAVIGGGTSAKIAAFGTDEKGVLLGIMPTNPLGGNGHLSNPSLGNTAIHDPLGRPLAPSIFVTDITSNAASRAGDWQQGGVATQHIDDIFGSWTTAATGPASGSYSPVVPATKNGNNLGAGSDPYASGLAWAEYGTEVRWNASNLKDNAGAALMVGHTYRFQVMLHDGDQHHLNNSGGDVGELCTNLVIPPAPLPTFSLNKAVDPATSPVSIGTPLKYTVTVKNTSTTAGDPGTVIDTITTAGSLTYTVAAPGYTASQGTLSSVNPGVVHWAVGNLVAGGSATLSYTLVPTSAGTLQNTAVNPNTTCVTPSTVAPCGTVTQVIAFALTKTVSPAGPVPVGTILQYTLTVTNLSPTVAGDPGTILDHISTRGGATYTVSSAPAGPGTVTGADPDYSWKPGSLGAGASSQLTIGLTVTGSGTVGAAPAVLNSAVDSLTTCTVPTNTPPCGTTTPVTSYGMTKTVDEAGSQPVGTVLHYHIKIHNLSATTAGDPGTVTDTISAVGGATYHINGVQSSQGSFTVTDPTITWAVHSLAGGATATLDLQLTVTGAGSPPTASSAINNTAVDVNTNCSVANTPACATHTPVLAPHLTIAKTVDQSTLTAVPGTVLYTVTVANDGTAPATNVLVDDLLGGDAGFLVNDGTRGTSNSFVGSPVVTILPIGVLGGHYQWTYPTVAPGDTDIVEFTVQMLLPGTVVSNTSGTVTLTNTASVPSYNVPSGVNGTSVYNNPGNNPSPVTVTTTAPYTCCATTSTPGGVLGITDTPTTGAGLNIELAGFLFLGGLGLILVGILARKPEGDIA